MITLFWTIASFLVSLLVEVAVFKTVTHTHSWWNIVAALLVPSLMLVTREKRIITAGKITFVLLLIMVVIQSFLPIP